MKRQKQGREENPRLEAAYEKVLQEIGELRRRKKERRLETKKGHKGMEEELNKLKAEVERRRWEILILKEEIVRLRKENKMFLEDAWNLLQENRLLEKEKKALQKENKQLEEYNKVLRKARKAFWKEWF